MSLFPAEGEVEGQVEAAVGALDPSDGGEENMMAGGGGGEEQMSVATPPEGEPTESESLEGATAVSAVVGGEGGGESLMGPGGGGGGTYNAPPSGPQATVWDLGDVLNSTLGPIKFKVTVYYADGLSKQCGEFDSEVGVRTDDVIIVGEEGQSRTPFS